MEPCSHPRRVPGTLSWARGKRFGAHPPQVACGTCFPQPQALSACIVDSSPQGDTIRSAIGSLLGSKGRANCYDLAEICI